MTKSSHKKCYIDNSGWGPEAGSIELDYPVPYGKIHVFNAKIGAYVPETDVCTDIVEPARLAQPAKHQVKQHHSFVGFTHGVNLSHDPATEGDTPVNSDGECSMGDMDSICPLYEGRLGGLPEPVILEGPQEPHRQVTIYMAGEAVTQDQPGAVAANKASGSGKTPTQAMADLMVEMSNLTVIAVTVENHQETNAELAKLRDAMAKIQREIEA
ncbi:hypothetical protein ZWY2020_038899 [Hordeum vulgare]|nr:hypothetical protein ZWY2020_038899 [Hordeum vulgare]